MRKIKLSLSLILSLSVFDVEAESLESILKSLKNSNIEKQIESEAHFNFLSQSVQISPWLTDLNLSLEKQFDYEENFSNRPNNRLNNLPANLRLNQASPYGLSLEFNYNRVLNDPTFSNVFSPESYDGKVLFSLYTDFLGRATRSILSGDETQRKNLYAYEALAKKCKAVTDSYVDLKSAQEKLVLQVESQKIMKGLYSKVLRASQRGALSKVNRISFEVDLANIESQKTASLKDLEEAKVSLEKATNKIYKKDLETKLKAPGPLSFKTSLVNFEESKLKDQIKNLQKRIAQRRLQNKNDISLYAGVNSRSFTNNVFDIEGETIYNLVGLQFNWKLNDVSYKADLDRLKSELLVKKNQLRDLDFNKLSYKKSIENNLKRLRELYKNIALNLKSVDYLTQKSIEQFRSGKIGFTELLSRRNQVVRIQNTAIETKKSFWKSWAQYLFETQDYQALCKNGGGA